MNFWRRQEVLDDRGRPVPELGLKQRSAELWRDRAGGPRLGKWLRLVAWPLLIAAILWGLWGRGPKPVVALGLIFGAPIALGLLWSAIYQRNRVGVRASVLWLTAYRVCGACGYGLAGVRPSEDGVATCPECGAAWHRDRWTLEGRDPRENTDLILLLERDRSDKRLAFDDRGVPMDPAPGWLPAWVRKGQAPAPACAAVRRQLRAIAVRRVLMVTLVAAGVYLGCVLALPRPSGVGETDVLALTFIFAVFFVLVLMWALTERLKGAHIRRAGLSVGLCPNCGGPMASGRAGFDGCTACRKCGRAWRLGEEAAKGS